MLIYFSLRLLFIVFNDEFYKLSSKQIARAFFYGLRFDLAAISLSNIPVIVLSSLPFAFVSKSLWQKIIHYLFVAINILFIFCNLIDIELYKYTGTRMTSDVLNLFEFGVKQVDQFLVSYWYVFLLLIILSCLVYKFSKRCVTSHSLERYSLRFSFLSFASFLFTVSLMVVAIRGGLQKKVLQPAHSFIAGNTSVGLLALNSTFTLLKSKANSIKKAEYFLNTEELYAQLKAKYRPVKNVSTENKATQNIVIIILESFATEFWGAANEYKGYTPFLDSLSAKGVFLKNNFSNGRLSMEALPAILIGIPSLMKTPIARSNFHSNQWKGLGSLLNKRGYHSSFFHGAPRGTMYFDAISAQAGLVDYYPLERYPEAKKDFDGHWGIFDEEFMQFTLKNLDQHREAFFSTLFTISTHQPYVVPSKYKDTFPKGTLKIHESVGYVDFALSKFFEEASKRAWYKNTLFIITGDHTQLSDIPSYNNNLGRFRVPLLFFHPEKKIKIADKNRITHHVDILPTVLDYLGIRDEKHLLFGRSILGEEEGEALLFSNGHYYLVRSEYFLQYNESSGESTLYSYKNDHNQKRPLRMPKIKEQYLKKIKAYLQYYRNGLLENNLYQY